MKHALLSLILSLVVSGCGSDAPSECAPSPKLEYAFARCGFSIAKTDAGYIRDYFGTPDSQCPNVTPLVDGVYRNNEKTCFFTVSNNGADISLERDTE